MMNAWPEQTWTTGQPEDAEAFDEVLHRAFRVNPNPQTALTLACVVVRGGRIVAERYGPHVTGRTRLLSWSVAKSITSLGVGIAAGDGLLDLDAPAPVPEWADQNDPRHDITLRQLLAMRDGLAFDEDYVDESSDCLEMLFGRGADNMAAYAAGRPLRHPPGAQLNYSSGSTNIVARALGAAVGTGPTDTTEFFARRLFEPIGCDPPDLRFDDAGTFIGSSYTYATARDFARIGLLALHDGVWDGVRLLPDGWMQTSLEVHGIDPDNGLGYGLHWWLYDDGRGTFAAKGYEGQTIMCCPSLDTVVVRMGKTPVAHRDALEAWYRDVLAVVESS